MEVRHYRVVNLRKEYQRNKKKELNQNFSFVAKYTPAVKQWILSNSMDGFTLGSIPIIEKKDQINDEISDLVYSLVSEVIN